MPDRPLNATAASLLGFLHDGPMAGWDLVATAQAVIGDFWSLTPSQVYRELAPWLAPAWSTPESAVGVTAVPTPSPPPDGKPSPAG